MTKGDPYENPSLQPDCIRRIASFDAVYPKEILKAAESLHAAGVGAVCHARRMDQPLVFIDRVQISSGKQR